MNPNRLPLPGRLLTGAKYLGDYWRLPGERCPTGWSLEICSCEPKKKFCKAKIQWLTLAIEAFRDIEDGPFGLVLAMTASEWDATKLGLRLQGGELDGYVVGTSKPAVVAMADLGRVHHAPEVMTATLRVMKAFPKSQVQGVEEAAPAVPEIQATVDLPVEPDTDLEAFE